MGGAARGPAPGRLIAPDLLRYHEGPGYGEAKRSRVGGLPSPGITTVSGFRYNHVPVLYFMLVNKACRHNYIVAYQRFKPIN